MRGVRAWQPPCLVLFCLSGVCVTSRCVHPCGGGGQNTLLDDTMADFLLPTNQHITTQHRHPLQVPPLLRRRDDGASSPPRCTCVPSCFNSRSKVSHKPLVYLSPICGPTNSHAHIHIYINPTTHPTTPQVWELHLLPPSAGGMSGNPQLPFQRGAATALALLVGGVGPLLPYCGGGRNWAGLGLRWVRQWVCLVVSQVVVVLLLGLMSLALHSYTYTHPHASKYYHPNNDSATDAPFLASLGVAAVLLAALGVVKVRACVKRPGCCEERMITLEAA